MSILRQLEEIFPNIAVEFLKGICDAYKDDVVDIEILSDLVLSFEFPPLKEDVKQYDSEDLIIGLNNGAEQSFRETEAHLIQNEQNNKTLSSPINSNITSGHSVKLKEPKINSTSNNINTIDFKTENNSPIKQMTASKDSEENCFQYLLENTCLTNTNQLLQKEIEVVKEGVRDDNNDLIILDNLNISECIVIIEGEYNEHVKQDSHQNTALTENLEDIAIIESECNGRFKQDTYQNISLIENAEDIAIIESECNGCVKQDSHQNVSLIENPEDIVIIESECNEHVKQDTHQTSSSIENLSALAGRRTSPNTPIKKPVFRSCKLINNKQRIINKNKPLRGKSNNKERKKIGRISFSSHALSQFESMESKHVLLSKIFPDADPGYLYCRSKNITNQEGLLILISEMLDKRNYPIKDIKKSVETKMDIFECTIDKFLEEYPDPMTVFSSHYYIRTDYEENAEIYLCSRYQNLDPELAKELLKSYNYNLTILCAELDDGAFKPSPYCLNLFSLHHPPSIYFHQEVWFIEHRTEIQNILDSAAVKVQVEVFECQVCSDEVTEYSDLGSCDRPTGHLFCKPCIKRHIEVQIGEGRTTFSCLGECEGVIDLQMVKELIPDASYSILLNKIQEEEIRTANIPGVETCPFCHFAYGPRVEEKLFTCLNPTCLKKTCRACRKEDHSSDICAEFQNENEETARRYIENKMTEALVRQCYKCGKNFVKVAGCNKMQCTCGALMCYLCRKPVQDYTHFNGPGGDRLSRCELFSEEATIHDRPVAASARQAFEELMANNPGINLDAHKIIPK